MDFFSDGKYSVLCSTLKILKHWITVDQIVENTADHQGENTDSYNYWEKKHIYNQKKITAFHMQKLNGVFKLFSLLIVQGN